MHKRSIRRAAVSDEDDSDVDMSAQPSHATAIAALKAKRQGIKPKRPVIAADLGEEEDAAPAVLVPKQPAQKPAPAPVQARQEVAKAKAAPVHKPAPRVDGLGGLRLADDYIPLDASRPARAPVGRSRLEAMVYPSSDESGDDTPAVVLDTPDTPSVSNYDTLRAVRDQLANQTERTAPHKLPSMASAGPTLTLHDLIDKYNAMLTEARGVLEEDTRELFRANQTAANASGLISKLESDLLDATQQYDFFSDNRRWVKALCGFLTAKVQDVSGLEAELVAVDTNGSIDTSSRFAADLLDELAEGAARGDERLLIAGTVPDPPAEVSSRDDTRLTGMVFGPEARIIRRRARLQKAASRFASRSFSLSLTPDSLAALSDCDDSDSESAARSSARAPILAKRETLFADTLPEYSDVSIVCDRLMRWKNTYPKSFEDAYIGMSLGDVFAPFIRLELLEWSPCKAVRLLSDFNWFNVLWKWIEGDSGDESLVPSIVSSTIIPRCCDIIQSSWNPASGSQTRNLVRTVQELLTFEPNGDAIQSIVQAVVGKLRLTIEELCVPLLLRLDSGAAVVSQLTARQFLRACKVLSLVGDWNVVVSEASLVDVGINLILCGKLLLVLECIIKTAPVLNLVPQCCEMLCCAGEAIPTALCTSALAVPALTPFRAALAEVRPMLSTASLPPDLLEKYGQVVAKVSPV